MIQARTTGNLATMALIASALCGELAGAADAIVKVEISNPSLVERNQEASVIAFTSMGLSNADSRTSSLYVMDQARVVPSELIDTDSDGRVDALLIVDSYAAQAAHHFSVMSDPAFAKPTIQKQTQAEISIKEGGQWNGNHYDGGHYVNVSHLDLPPQYTNQAHFIRYEGPGIESDKVAYRVYLDPRNGFDIFGKKIPDVVLQNVGHVDDSYEDDAPWGLDILKVGSSLGMGGFGYWNGKQVESVAVTKDRKATIVSNGNLYSAFSIQYSGWQVNNAVYDMSAMISMHAGSRSAHTQVKLASKAPKVAMPSMAIGVVKHPNTKLIQSDSNSKLEWGYAASWGKQSRIAPEEFLGMAVIFHRTQRLKQTEDEGSYVSVMDVSKGVLDYYFLAAWDKEPGGIKTEAEFKVYLDQEVRRLSVPLISKITIVAHAKKIH